MQSVFRNSQALNLCFQPTYNFGANLKQLKIRMKAIGNIRKITKAMKLVATSKMKIEVRRMNAGKDFGVGSVQKIFENESYLQKKKIDLPVGKTLFVPVTGDKGLCGGCNSQIVKAVKNHIGKDSTGYKIITIGDKGAAGLSRPYPDILHIGITQIERPATFASIGSIGHIIEQESLDCDKITIVYNEYKNVVTNYIRKVDLISRAHFLKNFKYVNRHEAAEPERSYSEHYLYELYLNSVLNCAILNAKAVEEASRMSAMENATKNAGEMLDKITLRYNNARQAKITMELIEIISGANAV